MSELAGLAASDLTQTNVAKCGAFAFAGLRGGQMILALADRMPADEAAKLIESQ